MPRRPLIPAALACLAGSALGYRLAGAAGVLTGASLAAAVAAGLAACFLRRRRYWLAVGAVFFFALWRALPLAAEAMASERDFAALTESDERAAVCGEVSAIWNGDSLDRGIHRHRFILKNCTWRLRGGRRRLRHPVLVEWYATAPEKGGPVVSRGDRIESVGNVASRRSSSRADESPVEGVRLISGATRTRFLRSRTTSFLSRVRDSAAATLSRGVDSFPEGRDLVLAMTLGLRSSIPAETREAFRRAGTIHIFAISGLHVGAIALIIVAFLSFAGVPRTYVVLPLAPLLAAYVCITGMQPSAIRAALMVCIYYFAILLRRRPDPLGVVALALVIILIHDPLAVADISLVLSFSMVAGMILFTGPITNICRRAANTELLLLERKIAIVSEENGDPGARAYRWPRDFLICAWNYCVYVFAAALSAALVSFPLTAHIFGTYVPYSLLANIIVVPLAFPVMAIAGIGLLVAAVVPPFAIVTNSIAVRLAWLMKTVSVGVASLPGSFILAKFPLAALIVWYALLLLAFRRRARQTNRDGIR